MWWIFGEEPWEGEEEEAVEEGAERAERPNPEPDFILNYLNPDEVSDRRGGVDLDMLFHDESRRPSQFPDLLALHVGALTGSRGFRWCAAQARLPVSKSADQGLGHGVC